MKTKSVLSFLLLIAYGMMLYSQESITEGKLYKNAVLQTVGGITFKANISVIGDSIHILRKEQNIEFIQSLQQINRIEIPTEPDIDTYRKNLIKGTGIGLGVGIITTVIVTYLYQQPREGTLEDVPWHCSEVICEKNCDIYYEATYSFPSGQLIDKTITKYEGEYIMKLSMGPKIIMIGLPTVIGFISGYTKKELRTLYLRDSNTLNKIDYDIHYDPYRKNISFNLCYKF